MTYYMVYREDPLSGVEQYAVKYPAPAWENGKGTRFGSLTKAMQIAARLDPKPGGIIKVRQAGKDPRYYRPDGSPLEDPCGDLLDQAQKRLGL